MKLEIDDLKEQLMVQKTIFDNAYDGLYIVNSEGYTEDVNKAYLKIVGLEKEELIGYHMEELRSKGYFTKSVVLKALETEKTTTMIFYHNGKKCLSTAKPVFYDNGKLFKIITSVRDITTLTDLQHKIEEAERLNKKYKEEINYLRQEEIRIDNVIGKSNAFSKVLELIYRVAESDATVLLTGETGTGKEVIAREIHRTSLRKDKAFIKVNCAAIPENLLESELFGYERGAFTGAVKSKLGKFELADLGTILLDEIGEMPISLQAKLLRVLQEKEITRLGGEKPIKIDVRVIASTNQNIEKLINEGHFREDLFYRLNVIPVQIPPLRKRKEDIMLLAEFFLKKYNKKNNQHKVLNSEALRMLEKYKWPGNIRELENLIERLVVASEHIVIDTSIILSFLGDKYFSQIDFFTKTEKNLNSVLENVEKQVLEKAVEEYKSTRKVAKVLGISQAGVVRKMKKYKIKG